MRPQPLSPNASRKHVAPGGGGFSTAHLHSKNLQDGTPCATPFPPCAPNPCPQAPHGSTWRPGEGASPQPTSAVKARKGAQAREARPCPGFSQLSVRGYVGEGEASLPSPARPMLPLPHQPLKLLYQFPKISQRRIHRCRRRHVHARPAQKLDRRLGAPA